MKRALVASALMLLAACGESAPPERHEEAHHEEPETTHHEGGSDAELLRMPAEMLRDLRLTTAHVEERSSAEEIVLLGQLAVAEDAYAEVAPPALVEAARRAAS